jgi:uncharacterized protein involved in response to NO
MNPPDKPPSRHIPIAIARAPAAPAPTRAAPAWLLAAPHRLFFFLAMVGLAAVSLWWLLQLVGRSAGIAMPIAVSPSWLHGWSMLSGFLPLFIFGFLFTAGPKWLDLPAQETRPLLPGGLLAAAGIALTLAGGHLAQEVAVVGVALTALAWLWLMGRFALLVSRSTAADKLHARLIVGFCVAALAGQLAWLVGLALGAWPWVAAGETLLLWGFLAPLYVTVAHRLIPFFTSTALPFFGAWRPVWLLVALLCVVLGHALLSLAEPVGLPALGRTLRALIDAAGGLLVLYVAWRWGAVQSLRHRLLAMLHIGFLWLGIALLMYAASDLAIALGHAAWSLGHAPLHVLTMGFFGSVMLAMVTRVTAGHGGRKLVADDLTWALYWMLQAAVIVRVIAEIAPAWRTAALLAAIALWCAAVLPWAARSMPVYLKARADGRPG